MPELPEVETVRRGLADLLPGHVVKSVKSDWAKSFPNAQTDVDAFLVGAKVLGVRRRAKVLIIDLNTNYSLVIHLKMTGQLVFVKNNISRSSGSPGEDSLDLSESNAPSRMGDTVKRVTEKTNSKNSANQAKQTTGSIDLLEGGGRWGAGHPNESLIGNLPDKSTRVIIRFDDAALYFNDQRKFGWMRLLPTIEIENLDFFKKVGPEPLSADFTSDIFIERVMRRKNSNIKSVLLDQTVLAGVGNIYADESLWGAKIHPSTLVKEISKSRLKILHKELIEVLQLAIEKGGSTDKNYVNAEGKKGSYMSFARVFRRENLPCPRCGTTIKKLRVAGRGTHICPKCQKESRPHP